MHHCKQYTLLYIFIFEKLHNYFRWLITLFIQTLLFLMIKIETTCFIVHEAMLLRFIKNAV